MAPLQRPDASADDSLRIALMLAQQLAELAEQRAEISYDDLMLDEVSGDALLDPYLDDDGPLPSSDTTQVAITPTRPPGETAADAIELQLGEPQDDAGLAVPLSADELQRLIEAGADLRIKQGYGEDVEGLGLYITDLLGKLPREQLEELRRLLQQSATAIAGRRGAGSNATARARAFTTTSGITTSTITASAGAGCRNGRRRRFGRVLQPHALRSTRSSFPRCGASSSVSGPRCTAR